MSTGERRIFSINSSPQTLAQANWLLTSHRVPPAAIRSSPQQEQGPQPPRNHHHHEH